MHVKLNDGTEWKATWEYIGKDGTTTLCWLSETTGTEYVAGFAHLHPNDKFCKETGRKVSLTDALRKFGFPKEDRRKFWEAYFGRRTAITKRITHAPSATGRTFTPPPLQIFPFTFADPLKAGTFYRIPAYTPQDTGFQTMFEKLQARLQKAL